MQILWAYEALGYSFVNMRLLALFVCVVVMRFVLTSELSYRNLKFGAYTSYRKPEYFIQQVGLVFVRAYLPSGGRRIYALYH